MYRALGKRLLDLLIAVSALLTLAPVLVVIGLLIKIDSPGPVFFRHRRLGKGGRHFMVLKFRSMVHNAAEIGPQRTLPGDKRVTRLGAKLRHYSLDELPQLWNVLKGEMSLVGPRPDVPRDQLSEQQAKRVSVAPGITGWAQVNGRSLLNAEQQTAYDIAYIDNLSFSLDLFIILRTVWVVLGAKGVNHELSHSISQTFPTHFEND